MFGKGEELLKLTEEHSCLISDIVIMKELQTTNTTKEEIFEKSRKILKVMESSSSRGLKESVVSVSEMSGGDAKKVYDYANSGKSLLNKNLVTAMARGFSTSEVNASMGKIVAAPTAGAAGILPAALYQAREMIGCDEDAHIRGLLTAGGIGEIVARNATVAGAVGGCQAECGSASAMAAAAIVEMSGGTPEMSLHAASFAFINIMGLVCDPIGGLVEYPCALRNASGVMNAFVAADIALAGVKSLIPFDEVVEAMYKVGQLMSPTLRETGLGGIAATPTAIELRKKHLNQED
ncbi:MAG: L-serine ammonia-lyase, iron-sulfur-dependent, subunit alpha [Tissierellia bacterium]|nr:L-serine ammonia-lyase, iron-sulfur-dependent, subunit alpha [Tissierellia bacterium]